VPKADAAARRLREVNSEVLVEPLVVDFTGENALELLGDCDLVVDATDNYLARFTLNEAALALKLPWVYGGAQALGGSVGVFMPGGPCFRCLFSDLPAPGATESCHVTGVLGSVTTMVAAMQVAEVIKIITGNQPRQGILHFDLRQGEFGSLEVCRDEDCVACKQKRHEFLDRSQSVVAEEVCGQDALLVHGGTKLDLASLCERLRARGIVVDYSRLRLRLPAVDGCEVVIFSDGRALVYGADSVRHARNIYSLILG